MTIPKFFTQSFLLAYIFSLACIATKTSKATSQTPKSTARSTSHAKSDKDVVSYRYICLYPTVEYQDNDKRFYHLIEITKDSEESIPLGVMRYPKDEINFFKSLQAKELYPKLVKLFDQIETRATSEHTRAQFSEFHFQLGAKEDTGDSSLFVAEDIKRVPLESQSCSQIGLSMTIAQLAKQDAASMFFRFPTQPGEVYVKTASNSQLDLIELIALVYDLFAICADPSTTKYYQGSTMDQLIDKGTVILPEYIKKERWKMGQSKEPSKRVFEKNAENHVYALKSYKIGPMKESPRKNPRRFKIEMKEKVYEIPSSRLTFIPSKKPSLQTRYTSHAIPPFGEVWQSAKHRQKSSCNLTLEQRKWIMKQIVIANLRPLIEARAASRANTSGATTHAKRKHGPVAMEVSSRNTNKAKQNTPNTNLDSHALEIDFQLGKIDSKKARMPKVIYSSRHLDEGLSSSEEDDDERITAIEEESLPVQNPVPQHNAQPSPDKLSPKLTAHESHAFIYIDECVENEETTSPSSPKSPRKLTPTLTTKKTQAPGHTKPSANKGQKPTKPSLKSGENLTPKLTTKKTQALGHTKPSVNKGQKPTKPSLKSFENLKIIISHKKHTNQKSTNAAPNPLRYIAALLATCGVVIVLKPFFKWAKKKNYSARKKRFILKKMKRPQHV
ncbi:MAG: hypothetical protein AAF380_01685 [Bacteroidota bacterium]